MDEILEGLNGTISIADDVGVCGPTAQEHDVKLIKLMERAAQRGLVFNSKKCSIKRDSIPFFGNIYTSEGIKPDSTKIEDVKKMSAPQSKDDLQRFLGMLTYLSQYILYFAEKAHPLRGLLKAGIPWTCDVNYQACFETLKDKITTVSSLQYYDPTIPVSLEVDASQKGHVEVQQH